ncbi:hypothetical protein CMI44_01770 [Candidatus Pacearchaeota archaeon]|jgi:hypothetical protein|nr:hypothetical protein [Candidatus Pacearchaeota archaeon]|tara:strand:+ start:963 stop:1295 length:333 start_codon:yes stop_codon:yes gene_type:complete
MTKSLDEKFKKIDRQIKKLQTKKGSLSSKDYDKSVKELNSLFDRYIREENWERVFGIISGVEELTQMYSKPAREILGPMENPNGRTWYIDEKGVVHSSQKTCISTTKGYN